MHDIDRTQLEMEWEADPYYAGEYEDEYEYDPEFEYEAEFEYDEFEAYPEMEWEAEWEWMDTPFSEAEEMELAADLLEVTDDAELEYFIGKLLKKVSRKARKALKSPTARALGGMLKNVAKKTLPAAGAALASAYGVPPQLGAQGASALGRIFGLELEGLSPEDQEFEVARRYVRLAGDAAKQAVKAPPGAPPQAVAQKAIAAAAQKHAPGLTAGVVAARPMPAMVSRRRGHRGVWKRKGNRIVLYGV